MKCKFKGCGDTLLTIKGFQRHIVRHIKIYSELDQFLERFDKFIEQLKASKRNGEL